MDSLRPDTEQYFQRKGTRIIKNPDQYSTDLTKCLEEIKNQKDVILSGKWKRAIYTPQDTFASNFDVVILGGLGGRFDQGLSLLHHLYKFSEQEDLLHGRFYMINSQSISFLLSEGENRIETHRGLGVFGENVGIIPISRPALITTKGLEWDVTDWPTEFGTQISTSNHIRNDTVQVHTSERVLFTIEINDSVYE